MFSFQGSVCHKGYRRRRWIPYDHTGYLHIPNGDGEIRTLDPLLARQVLSQLSYTPIFIFFNSGSHLSSRVVSNKVLSAD